MPFAFLLSLIFLVYSPLKSDKSLNQRTSPKVFKTLNFTSCVCSVEKEKLNPLLNGFGKTLILSILTSWTVLTPEVNLNKSLSPVPWAL